MSKIDCDIIVNIQGDEPKIDSNIIDNLILLFNDPLVEMASVASTDLNNDDLSNLMLLRHIWIKIIMLLIFKEK